MKILTVVGARPQFIKAATVSREFKKAGIREILVHTGQHFDDNMSKVFFDEMEIPHPDYNLEVSNLGHGAMTGRMMEKIEQILIAEKPDWVLVYGDTNSTLAGALAASKLHIPVAHVEAGLRSFEMTMPEEVNRILSDRISSVLFCPTDEAVQNLHREGFKNFDTKIVRTGDVMYDAINYYKEKAASQSTVIQRESLGGKPFVLVTMHRAENTDDSARLKEISNALLEINKEVTVVWPVHPRTRAKLPASFDPGSMKLIDPVGYFDMLMLLEKCSLVLTDSGGLQKEAFIFNKFCITLRDQTEWVELIKIKANYLAGANQKKILSLYRKVKKLKFPKRKNLYGDGKAAAMIVKELRTKN